MRIRYLFFFIGLLLFFPQSAPAYTIVHHKDAPDKAVLRLVFCPLHYRDNRDFLDDIGIITKKLFKLKPFSEFEGRIAFSYLTLSPEPGYPNCATSKKDAQEWWGDLVDRDSRVNYITGCSGNKGYIRPTIASLMNDAGKAEDFGPVNERYLRKVLRER